LNQARSTQRHPEWVPDDEPPLVSRIVALAMQYGRYGYRRITALLHQEGWRVNHKRVERLWRREYHQVRPHSALGYRPPAPETREPLPPGSAALRLPAMAP